MFKSKYYKNNYSKNVMWRTFINFILLLFCEDFYISFLKIFSLLINFNKKTNKQDKIINLSKFIKFV